MNFQDDTIGKQEVKPESPENWANPNIDALLDTRALKLLSKQEVIDKLRAMKGYLEKRLATLKDSRTNVSDFINQMVEGSAMEQQLDRVAANIEALQMKMY